MSDFTAAQRAAMAAEAAAIATRGIKSVTAGDRRHDYLTPEQVMAIADTAAVAVIDDTYAGFLPITMSRET